MRRTKAISRQWRNITLCASLTLLFATAHTWAIAAEASAAPAAYSFSLAEKPGPHPVGFKVVEQYDSSRSFRPLVDDLGKPWQGETARPIQTAIWYPAQNSSSKRMTVDAYIGLGATEVSFGKPNAPAGGLEEWLIEGLRPSFGQPLLAVRDAQSAAGRFPVIIYAPSFSSGVWENADLCEYLASHGYVVIASPAMGVGRQSTRDLAGTDAQARDVSFLIGYAGTLANANVSDVAVVGFSWGGLASLFSAARDNRIDALVALDGSMRYYPGLVQKAGDVVPEKMTLPLLYFKSQSSIESQAQLEKTFNSGGPSVLNAWTHGDLVSVQMLGLVHPQWSRGRGCRLRLGRALYAGVSRCISETQREGDAVPSLTSFKAEVGRKGFDRAAEIYDSLQNAAPGFKLSVAEVLEWGYSLLGDRHYAEATEVMKLGIHIEPSSAAHTGLATAYQKAGQKQQAILSFEAALAKDPNSLVIKELMAGLGGSRHSRWRPLRTHELARVTEPCGSGHR